jgi:hypothetical protein
MKDDVLVIGNRLKGSNPSEHKGSSTFKFKVVKQRGQGADDQLYQNTINIKDPKQLALVLSDLKTMFGAPVDKALLEMKKNKKDIFW